MPTDRVPFYENEQYASDDLNLTQRVIERFFEDLAAFPSRSRDAPFNSQGPGFDSQPPAAMVGGLNASIDGTSLIISPGMLTTTLVADPDNESLSGAYLVVNPAFTAVPIPSPPGDTWYIVTCKPVLVDAPAVARNVFDPAQRKLVTPTPSLVKRKNAKMQFAVEQGSATLLPGVLTANTVPLFAVFRPGGAGAITGLYVVDLRPCKPLPRARQGTALYLSNRWRYGAALTLNVSVQLDEVEMSARTSAPVDPMAFAEPGESPSANQWWYLYLARGRNIGELVVPRSAQPALPDVAQEGILIFSPTPPFDADTGVPRLNGQPITAPAPFSLVDVAIGDAICFGALRRNAGNTGWRPAQCDGDHVVLFEQTALPTQGISDGVAFNLASPVGARTVDLNIYSASGPFGGVLYVEGANTDLGTNTRLWQTPYIRAGSEMAIDMVDVPIASSGRSLKVVSFGGGAATYTVMLRGYRL